ncbi:Svp26 [Kluyveromyces lactis]|nr:Svp26 [Kluyveromyces lactis]
MIIQLLSYAGTVLGFIFLTLSTASGLYYLSELVEEYTEPTRRLLYRAIYTIIGIYVLLLLFDGFPWLLTAFSIFTYVVYLQNMKQFPYISLTNPTLMLSCVLVLINHYLWFKYFNDIDIPPQFRFDPNYVPRRRASFAEVASFFGICVWFIPFALFVSLSAGENVLPTHIERKKNEDGDGAESSRGVRRRAKGLAKIVIDYIREYFYSIGKLFGLKDSKKDEGLLL